MCGITFGILKTYARSGMYGKINYLKHPDTEILILGSSRAHHHYNSVLIGNQLKMKCYNAGMDGQSIYYSYLVGKKAINNSNVKLVILDVSPNIFADPLSEQKLKVLLPFRKEYPELLEILSLHDKFAGIKSKFNLYNYNSKLLVILKGINDKGDSLNYGFTPLNDISNSINIPISNNTFYDQYDHNKIIYFEKLINQLSINNIKVAVVISPMYAIDYNSKSDTPIFQEICRKYQVSFFDFSMDSLFTGNKELFKDQLHLNGKGANIFSDKLSSLIRDKIPL